RFLVRCKYMETIEGFFRNIIISWRRIRRWQGRNEAEFEDDLMHSFKTAMQTLLVLALEENEEIKSKRLELLILALNHDISEACVGGDIIAPIKKDPRMLGIIDEIEAEEFDKYFSVLPSSAFNYLKAVNRIQGDKEKVAGRFFQAIEYFGYSMFSLAEAASEKSPENTRQFRKVLINHHEKFLKLCDEFPSFKLLYGPFIPQVVSNEAVDAWNFEISLRRIIGAWESSRAWPEFSTEETVLDRTMKTAMLASILLPIETEIRKEKGEKELDGFKILSCALVHNIAKSFVGVLSYRLKTHPKFPHRAAREIEREYFLKIIDKFPAPAKALMIESFDLEHDSGSQEGRFFDAIKVFSYATFALYEYEHGNEQYKEILMNCYPRLMEHSGEFKSFDMFFIPIRHRIESIVEERPRLWSKLK
ncbi:MAG: YfbR-like 5'-deoxynucleotidase, partial [Patescibacteria group bacterium]|nr:YfbR-like 5'-deoxynucleotidase [Patescibacteria group bacterium]